MICLELLTILYDLNREFNDPKNLIYQIGTKKMVA
jgi:hypothetical protein